MPVSAPIHWLLFNVTIIETMISGERRINLVTKIIFMNALKEQGKPCFQVLYAITCKNIALQSNETGMNGY